MPWLVESLDDPYPEVQRKAWDALKSITGLDLLPSEWFTIGI